MNLYFHDFRTAAFSGGKDYTPVIKRIMDKSMMAAPIFVLYSEASLMAHPGYHDLTGTGQVYSARRFKALLVKMLAEVVGSLLGGSDWYNFGRLMNEGLGNSVS
jgi:hypothetical protein